MDLNYFRDKRVWLTGASLGIGRALALELAARGARLALSARNPERLRQLADEIGSHRTLVLPLDVTDHGANRRAADTLAREWDGVDIAIFNAGTAEYVDARQFDADLFRRVLDTNFMSMVYGIEAVLPLLRRSPTPHLVGVSSTVAYAGIPRAEAYGASKAAVRNMLQALGAHVRHEGIAVSTVCPGFVRTPLTDKNDFPMPMRIEANDAAKRVADGIARRQAEIHFPKAFSLLYKLLAALPAGLYTRIMSNTVRQS
jgi:short-subunit dehydrogenase